MIRAKEKERSWWREVRSRVFPAHPFVKETHCGDCRRFYNRNWMRRKRGSLLEELF